jgi:predicted Zn finger-like uncharacterized protein
VIVSCPSCKARYQYDESRFGEALAKKLKCTKCDTVFDVTRPGGDEPGERTIDGSTSRPVEDTTKQYLLKGEAALQADADLPQLAPLLPNRRYSLAIILGANAGQIYPITRPRTVLGRGAGSDLQLQDSEVSRRHAMLEIRGDEASVSDLSSTNGTFVDGVRVQKAAISSNQEFSLGTTTLMFIVTDAHGAGAG